MIFLIICFQKKIIAILECQVKRDAQGRTADMVDNLWYMCYVSLQLFSPHTTCFFLSALKGKPQGT